MVAGQGRQLVRGEEDQGPARGCRTTVSSRRIGAQEPGVRPGHPPGGCASSVCSRGRGSSP